MRQRASELLRRVQAGETIEVTDRGRPVALLTPVPAGDVLEQLRASGDLSPAVAAIDDLPQPLKLPPGVPSASSVLAELRRHER